MYSSPGNISSTLIVKGSDVGKVDAYYRKVGQKLGPPRQRVSLGTLPDDILLEIFDLYQDGSNIEAIEEWQTLVHVCSRWRNIVFSFPRRLELELYCCSEKRMKMLDIWPTLPIFLSPDCEVITPDTGENVTTVLQQHDRICAINLEYFSNLQFEKFVAAMQEPFPELTFLSLSAGLRSSDEEPTPLSPESFLGCFAPRLRELQLDGIPFPQLNKFLVSANCNNIIYLDVAAIPHSGYISPEAMAACLSLSRLKYFTLGFRSPLSRPNRETLHPPHLTPTVLPTLISLDFGGCSEYLEDLVSRIDVPLLASLEIRLFHQLTFDHSQLARFISRTEKLKAFSQADITLSLKDISASFTLPTGILAAASDCPKPRLKFEISCSGLDWQTSSMEQVCRSTLPSLSNIERLNICEFRPSVGYGKYGPDEMEYPQLLYDMDNSQWLELFFPFTGVKDLYLSKEVGRRIAPALQEPAGERATEVLPALQDLSVEGLQSSGFEDIEKFIAMRQLANHAIALHNWEREP
ncbi:hypothetical protein BC827DRAFT_1266387 [Russula dissimulans]|nr:hypothetical protein BC827DRAFT_1266387 [Russula dissimulans]